MRKIVFDFDGVLTDLTHEAISVVSLFEKRLGEQKVLLSQVEKAFKSSPLQHGWKVHGRISAFFNEDLFVHNIATASALDLSLIHI